MDINKYLEEFNREEECLYKRELYSVRDNGAILRHPQPGKRPRPNDNKWTFGKPNNRHGYMEIGSARVHIIIATAFLGERSSKIYVVDHIDTNRQNNRLENLRWLTRLENVLSNPITRKKIEFICGCSAEEFLSNPDKYKDRFDFNYSYGWMRTVSKEEGMACLKHGLLWAASDNLPSGGLIGEWIFKSNNSQNKIIDGEEIKLRKEETIAKVFQRVEKVTGLSRDDISSKSKKKSHLNARVYTANQLRSELNLILSNEEIGELIGISKSMVNEYINHPWSYLKNCDYYQVNNNKVDNEYIFEEIEEGEELSESLTPNAIQRNWRTPTEFPFTPQIIDNYPLISYANNIIKGKVFSCNKYGSTLVIDRGFSENKESLFVITKTHIDNENIKSYFLTKITFEKGLFVHSGYTFFTLEGAEKEFILAQGLKWTGEDSIDDYC